MLVVMNFGAEAASVTVDLEDRRAALRDIWSGQRVTAGGHVSVALPGYGYGIFTVEPNP